MVQGLGTTAYESLAVAAVGDMFFLHQRGIRTSLLVLTTACLASFVAICAGHMFEVLGARNLFVVLLPLQLFGFICSFLFIPETQFRRNETRGAATEHDVRVVQEKAETSTQSVAQEPTVSTVNPDVTKRTFVQDLRLTSGVYNQDSVAKLLGRIFVHLLNPAIVWITLVAAILIVRNLHFHPPLLSLPRTCLHELIHPVLLRRHRLHPRTNFHAPSLRPHRQPKRLLLHRRPPRWHLGRHLRPSLRLLRQTPLAPQQRRLRSRVPYPC
jgi:MFS family permease